MHKLMNNLEETARKTNISRRKDVRNLRRQDTKKSTVFLKEVKILGMD